MARQNPNSEPITPELPFGENYTILPDDLAANEELLIAAERGIRHAKGMFEHPETSVIPTQQFVDDIDAPTTTEPVNQSIVGSRAKHGSLSSVVEPIADVSSTFGNPEGRSPDSLRRQRVVLDADLNTTRDALEARKRR